MRNLCRYVRHCRSSFHRDGIGRRWLLRYRGGLSLSQICRRLQPKHFSGDNEVALVANVSMVEHYRVWGHLLCNLLQSKTACTCQDEHLHKGGLPGLVTKFGFRRCCACRNTFFADGLFADIILN